MLLHIFLIIFYAFIYPNKSEMEEKYFFLILDFYQYVGRWEGEYFGINFFLQMYI